MYSKELEEIIDAALADGEITEKERAVLHKRAAAEGIDPDELDVVIEGRLAKMKKVEKDWLRPMPPHEVKSDKYGDVRKCPQCGAVVQAGSVKCSDCGYTFRGIEANSSVEKLSRQIQEANDKYKANTFFDSMGWAPSKRTSAIYNIILNFPVPNTKEDLLEFILFLKPKIKMSKFSQDASHAELRFSKAYEKKYYECVEKARLFFPDDEQFIKILPPEKKGLFGGLFGKK